MALTKVVRHLSSTPSIVDGGNATAITIDSSENISLASHVQVADNKNLKFGDDTDAQLYYNSSNDIFYIYNSGANGGTIIQNNSASGGIVLQPVPNENAVFCAPNGEVILYHNSSAKLTTTSTGITVTGAITGTLASTVTATTQSAGTNSTLIATTAYTDAAITALVGGAPATLDTLNEIAASVNDDANYVGTVNSLLAAKAPLASPTFTGTVTTSGNLDINGNQLILDADADTSIRESADDYLIMKVGGTDLIKIDASGLGIGIRPAEMLDIQSASGDARIRLDAPAGSDTEVKFFNAGSAQYTIGHDDGTDNFVIGGANVDAPYVNVTKAGYVGIGITDPSDYYAKNLVVNSGAEGGITIVGGTGHVNYLMFADGTSGNTQYRGYIEYSHITDGMKLNTAGTPALTLDISQNAIFTNDIKFTSDAGGNIGLNSGNRPNNISMAGGLGVNAAAGGAGTIAFSGDITQAQGDYLYSGGTNFDIKHTVASQNIIISTRPSGGSITPRMRITHDGKFGMGDTPSNLTSEIITITTPASGGGQGIAFKRLDSNNDQTVGQIRFSNNATDNLAYIRCITDGDTTSSRLEFHTNTGSATAANLVIKKNGNVAINYGLGGGAINSKFNVFADGEALRLDGTANTSRTLRFRNAAVNGSGNAIITSDGILQIKTEDANAHIYVNSVRDIAMQVTSLNGTAGHFTFSSYNTEIMRIDGANNRVGIGTGANPNLKLHVEENADTWVGEFKNVRGAGGYGLRVDMSAGSATDTRYALGVYTPGNSGLFVRNNGNVGIGTTAPSDTLVVQRSTANIEPILVIKNDNTTDDNGVSIDFSGKDTSSNHVIYGRIATKYTNHSTEKSHMIFTHRNNSGTFDEWMRVNHDGQVGIGTASPSAALSILDDDLTTTGQGLGGWRVHRPGASSQYGYGEYSYGGGGLILGSLYSGGGSSVFGTYEFKQHSSDAVQTPLFIGSTGNVGIGNTNPAARLHVSIPAIAAGTDLQKQGIVVSTPFTSGYQSQSSGLLSGYDGALHATAIGMVYENPGYALTFFTNDNTSGLPIERVRIDDSGTVIVTNSGGNANKGILQFSTQASTYQLLGGNNIGYLGYKTGGYHRWFGSDGSEDMRLDSSGRLGINRTPASANSKLELGGADDVRLLVVEASGHTGGIGIKGGTGSDKGLKLFSGGQIKIQLSDQSNVAYAYDGLFHANARPSKYKTSGSGQMLLGYQDNGSGLYSGAMGLEYDCVDGLGNTSYVGGFMMKDTASGTVHVRIETQGDMHNTNNSYGSISDSRVKTDIIDASSQWDDVKALRIRKYKLATQPAPYNDQFQIGVIAQELESAGMNGLIKESEPDEAQLNYAPELVGEKVKSVKYSILYMKAIKALQEAMTRIETLEARVTELES
jgi:hypothetical protein